MGNERFKEMICAAAGVRRVQGRRGRPEKAKVTASSEKLEQIGFGF